MHCNLANFSQAVTHTDADLSQLKHWIKQQALALGFSDCGIVTADDEIFSEQLIHLKQWLKNDYHGQMQFLQENHDKRANPTLLVEGTKSIISVRLDYLVAPPPKRSIPDELRPNHAIIARYARGRDYHKIMRGRLKTLAQQIFEHLKIHYPHLVEGFIFRPFSDSAPIFERALAEKAGLGWTGKHTLLIHRQAGSFFVLGELFTSLPLPADNDVQVSRCGSCSACLKVCPTQAIIAPYQVDARLCISYLTIEFMGSIPLELRAKIGNRIFGCDDCQLICPWNRYAKLTTIDDFLPRHQLDTISLLDIWQWNEKTFLKYTEGSPLRRTGYENMMRNVAVALGNASFSPMIIQALMNKQHELSELVQEHIDWAIHQQQQKQKIDKF